MLIGLANDEIGYIIPKRQWDEKPPFCYGRKKAQYGEENSLGPDTAPLLCKAFKGCRSRGTGNERRTPPAWRECMGSAWRCPVNGRPWTSDVGSVGTTRA